MSIDVRPATPSMTPSTAQHGARPRSRDGAVDLARAWCLIVVVAMHALMVGVSVDASGPVLQNALDSWPALAPFTWFAQIMPLFFVLGGFSAFTQYTALSLRGVTASAFVALRMRRLLRPAVAAIAAMVIVLAVLTVVGVPGSLVAIAGFRLSQPLWFLGVYALTTALVPLALAAHRRSAYATATVLALAVVSVDVVRAATGIAAFGFVNLLFVWLLVQQLGFWLAEDRLPHGRLALLALAAGAYAALAVLCGFGAFSFDLLSDLNPPSFALVLLGVGQLVLFRLLAPTLRRMHAVRPVNSVATWINARSLTVYLWHMLVLVLMAGALLLSGASLPTPLSGTWWESRPVWLLCVVASVGLVTALTARWEAPGARGGLTDATRAIGWGRASCAAALGAGGVVVILITGLTMAGGVVGLACIAAGLRLAAVRGDVRPARGAGAPVWSELLDGCRQLRDQFVEQLDRVLPAVHRARGHAHREHGVVVPVGVEPVADEEHLGETDARQLRQPADSVSLVDALTRDIHRRRTPGAHLEVG